MSKSKGVGAQRRARRDEAVALLQQAQGILNDLAEEVRNAFEALPEGLQQSEQGQAKEQAADTLEESDRVVADTIEELEAMEL